MIHFLLRFHLELIWDVCSFSSPIIAGLQNRPVRVGWTTRLLAGAKVHHGQWPEGPPVHCAVSQPVSAHQLLS